jgi:putative acetyltransferase
VSNLELLALVVRDDEAAIQFFVHSLQFELVEARKPVGSLGPRSAWRSPRLNGASVNLSRLHRSQPVWSEVGGPREDSVTPLFVIQPGDFGDHRVKALLTRHLEGMHANSPAGHVFALDWAALQRPEITFYTLWEGAELLGFGALKELDPGSGEIKSMRTADAHLRRGVAAAILEHILGEARRRGYSRLSLETGSGPAFEPALALYRRYGFTNGGAFGTYQTSPFNQFLHLGLPAAGP